MLVPRQRPRSFVGAAIRRSLTSKVPPMQKILPRAVSAGPVLHGPGRMRGRSGAAGAGWDDLRVGWRHVTGLVRAFWSDTFSSKLLQ